MVTRKDPKPQSRRKEVRNMGYLHSAVYRCDRNVREKSQYICHRKTNRIYHTETWGEEEEDPNGPKGKHTSCPCETRDRLCVHKEYE